MIGIRIAIGRSSGYVRWPWDWGWSTSLMWPRWYGFGIWIERG